MGNKKERNSSLEALKLLAIIFIVISHSIPSPTGNDGDYTLFIANPTDNLQQLALVVMKQLGQIGNGIFIICSSWFLMESRRVNSKKILEMAADQNVISLVILAVFIAVGYELPTREIVKQFFPMTYRNNWFVVCYLMFYAIHPALNMILDKLDRKTHLGAVMVMLVLYSGINFIIRNSYHYTELIGFVYYYFTVAYIKKYMSGFSASAKANSILLAAGAAGMVGLVAVTNILGSHIGILSDKLTHWNIFINPFIMCVSVALFNLANRKHFTNRAVNYISGLSLLIYMIHCNRLVVIYLTADFFGYVYAVHGYRFVLLWVLAYAFILLSAGTVLAIAYRETVQKLVGKVCGKIYPLLCRGWERLSELLMKVN